jgi:chemosensory pili system protein ChpA (sensor histidine kinase/response regulator)
MGEDAYAADPPTSLINNLLYYVARSRSTGPRSEAIRDAFNLAALVPGDEQVEQLRENLTAPSQKLMHTVADAIREDLAKTKDVLDIFVRTGMQDVAELEPHVALLEKISDTLGVLGLGSLREVVRERSRELQAIIVAGREEADVSRLISLAAALLEVEDGLDSELASLVQQDFAAPDQPVDAEYQQVMQAVMRECIVNLSRVKEVISDVVSNPHELGALDSLGEQLNGIYSGLRMLGKDRAVETLKRVDRSIHKFVSEDIRYDSQTLNRLADAIVSLEYYLETMAAGRKEPLYMLDNADRCLDVIDSTEPLAESEEAAQGGTMRLDVSELQPAEPQSHPEISKTSVFDEDIARPDPEILELFIEEAGEEIISIQRHFPVWQENMADTEALITLRRSFHTLKGSGRMVGATSIGEFSWAIENLLNRVINQTVETTPALLALVSDAVQALPQLLEEFEAGAEPPANLEQVTSAAAVFCAGEVPEKYAALNKPEDEAEAGAAIIDGDALDPVLLEILDKETAGHLDVIRKFVAGHADSPGPVLVTEALQRACHTLKGSMTMANATEAVAIAAPFYELVDLHFRREIGLDPLSLEMCRESAEALAGIMLHLATPESEQPDFADLRDRLKSRAVTIAQEASADAADTSPQPILAEAADVDLVADEMLVPSALHVTGSALQETESEPEHQDEIPAPEPAPETVLPQPEFDAEIAAIFVEEATEILHAADRALELLAEDFSASEPMAEMQRHLHTLKGGARMAGIVTMGDFSHELESLLMRINQGGMGVDQAAYALLQASFDELHRMHDEVHTGSVAAPGAELMQRLSEVVEATMMTPALVQTRPEQTTGPKPAAAKTPTVPEPEGLGELARELTKGQPPAEPRPLPENLLPPIAATAPQAPDAGAPRRELARVDAAMLEDLLNSAGEISISHSRLNQQLSSIQFNLEELGTTVLRLQQQLRLLEMETEAQILFKHQSEGAGNEDFDPLEMDRYSTIQQLSRALVETANDVNSIKELLRNLAADAETILVHQKRTTSSMQDSLMRTRMVPFDQHVPRLSRLVRQQAQESGKQVELVVRGSSGELDRQVMEKMLPPFEHMLRNAIIHGIEAPAERRAAGKPEQGTITISFARQGSEVLIEVSDDGAGLNLNAVKQKALERGVLKPDERISDDELAQLIFHSGLSTASAVTQAAGRGIGMDVVVSEVAKLGGRLMVQTEPGKHCTFTVRLPYTLAISQAFIVRVGQEHFALPLSTVEGIARLSRADFEATMRTADPQIEQRGNAYRLRQLGPLLGLSPSTFGADADQIPLILVRAGDNRMALIVDETADHREVVVKPMGPLLASIRGIAGATILGDGSIVVILDTGALVRDLRPDEAEDTVIPVVSSAKLAPLALVVDDSITMRRVTQRLLERNGLRVITAKDGVDAVAALQDKTPDIIVLDIEMPRMDGYEFASHVRNLEATQDIPIIMVTSRVGEKHRARAIELGVNDYLGKPYQEHEMLDAIRNILGDDVFDTNDKMGDKQSDPVDQA